MPFVFFSPNKIFGFHIDDTCKILINPNACWCCFVISMSHSGGALCGVGKDSHGKTVCTRIFGL